MKSRAAIIAHYDPAGVVDPHVGYYLDALDGVCGRIVLVTTSRLASHALEYLASKAITVIQRENVGYDFMSYRAGLRLLADDAYDEIIICNDSVYGPFRPLADLFAEMGKKSCDFWGITESREIHPHLQSYFLVFRRRVVESDAFGRFWRGVRPLSRKKEVIQRYEVGLTRTLATEGFRGASYCRIQVDGWQMLGKLHRHLTPDSVLLRLRGLVRLFKQAVSNRGVSCNVTHWFWEELLTEHRMPFLKIELLRDNPERLRNVGRFETIVQTLGDYPVGLIRSHLRRFEASRT